MRKLATLAKIEEIRPIENADRIEKIRIRDWWVVSEKGNFKIGDFAVYFEVDSLLPSSNPIFQFLANNTSEKIMIHDNKEYKGYRLKTKKIKGTLSQGLALPMKLFTNIDFTGMLESADISEKLNIVKYEKPISAQLGGFVKGPFPSFIPKTDEERVQNLGDLVKQKAGTIMYVTEKINGSSTTYYKKDGILGVCSRNLELLENEGNTLWKIAKTYKMRENIPNNIAIQGELVGEGIQNNPLKLHGQDFYVFNVFDITKQKFHTLEEMEMFCKEHELTIIPVLDRTYILQEHVNEILEAAEGFSTIAPTMIREGIVIRPLQEEIVEIDGYPTRFSFKAISNTFLLQEKE